MKYYVVDAFTEELFKGNPAGVCLLEKAIPDVIMQKIAHENNLAETAFLLKDGDTYKLKWFTPEVEIDLCGHATLATAFVVMNYVEPKLNKIAFETMSGTLIVTRNEDLFTMDFPSRMPKAIQKNELLEEALGCKVLETYLSRDLIAVVESEEKVKNLQLNIDMLSKISKDIAFAIAVTAKGDTCDFVSRFFAPNAGIIEDPVTGSSHSSLIPFWSERLHKDKMIAKQLSQRGGQLVCENLPDRVHISGKAVCFMKGSIELSE
jgi:PhzF family phenazine biosynthesis protein